MNFSQGFTRDLVPVTYYVCETITLCRFSLGLGPVAYEHRALALTQ